jgi:ribose-phosphate pyrophosphokinase
MDSQVAQRPGGLLTDSTANLDHLRLFSGSANPQLAAKVAEYLKVKEGSISLKRFADGEVRVDINESARGGDVFLVQPTSTPVNEHLMEVLILLDAFRRASARRITVVMPYYGYARQDKKLRAREPVTARLVADLLETAGADRIVSIDLHAEQIQGFFRIPVDHLYAGPILAEHFVSLGFREMDDVVVVSPDAGGVPRARALADLLKSEIAIIAKRRPEPNQVTVTEIIGDVKGKTCVMIDDMIDTGGSIVVGAEALMERGAKEVIACCTHGLFSGGAPPRLQNSCLSKVVATDTIPMTKGRQFDKLTVLPVAPLLGEAIRRIHTDESVSTLFKDWR